MENMEAVCPSCSPDSPTPHMTLKRGKEHLLKCKQCGSVHKEKEPKKMLVRVIVSKEEKSIHIRTLLSGVINVGDELLVDDEKSGEAYNVKVSSIEVGDKRKESASAEDIKTVWARMIEEVIVKIAVSQRETTESLEMRVPGDRDFVIGETVNVDDRRLKIIRIKIRDGGFKSRKGASVKAKDIKRIYADSGIKLPGKLSTKGERVVIKKRESVWSLKKRIHPEN